jgi:hypothetical protein
VSADIDKVKELMATARDALATIESYSCVIRCHERINGKVRKPENIFSYFKRPASVYLRWQPGPYAGLQSSYVPGRDGPDKFQARETGLKGLAGAITVPHSSPLIMKAYPHYFRTHETSLRYLVDLSSEIMNRSIERGSFKVLELTEVTDPLIKRPATRAVTQLAPSPVQGLSWMKAEFAFDHQTEIPLHFRLYEFDGGMSGDYAFTELKTNLPLTDADFELKKI